MKRMEPNRHIQLNKLLREYNEETEKKEEGWILIKIPYEKWKELKEKQKLAMER